MARNVSKAVESKPPTNEEGTSRIEQQKLGERGTGGEWSLFLGEESWHTTKEKGQTLIP